uniref:NADH dehydrogenase subunit 2 n=1 Tax=Asemonea sichuanensis TaxID=426804 RepID=UPI001FAF05C2|nr:NADH dehydrogenase subunit 2 [Asemonea sichuanensis]ULX45809.1 NADH dehydrogenase subunit 2 [Asemonea sichuanensis]
MFLYMISFMFVIGSNDWFVIWLGLEINMISFLILIFNRFNISIIESCFKYFFIQSMGSAIFISMFYLMKINMSMLCYMILMYSVGAGPFFYWFISVSKGISLISLFFLMTFQKFIPFILSGIFLNFIGWLFSIISLLMGVLGSFNQSNIKMLLSYSSVHHLGWIILCMMSNDLYWMIYLFMYSFMLFFLMYVMMNTEIIDFYSLMKSKGKMWFMMMLLGMGGMPPFVGFFLKWMAFYMIMEWNSMMFMFLIMMSVSMFYIYLRMVYDIMMGSYKYMSWYDYSLMWKFFWKWDYISIFGMMLGLIFGMILLM